MNNAMGTAEPANLGLASALKPASSKGTAKKNVRWLQENGMQMVDEAGTDRPPKPPVIQIHHSTMDSSIISRYRPATSSVPQFLSPAILPVRSPRQHITPPPLPTTPPPPLPIPTTKTLRMNTTNFEHAQRRRTNFCLCIEKNPNCTSTLSDSFIFNYFTQFPGFCSMDMNMNKSVANVYYKDKDDMVYAQKCLSSILNTEGEIPTVTFHILNAKANDARPRSFYCCLPMCWKRNEDDY